MSVLDDEAQPDRYACLKETRIPIMLLSIDSVLDGFYLLLERKKGSLIREKTA